VTASPPARRAPAAAGPQRLGLSLDEAAATLGVSRDTFDRHIRHELRIVRRGRCLIVPVSELERWLDREAARWAS
jgi:excisionase family DNA binding protein